MVLAKIKEKYHMFGLTKQLRIQNYLNYVGEKIKITDERDMKNAQKIEHMIEERLRAVKSLNYFIIMCYLGIYFSFVSYIFSDLFLLSDIAQILSKFFGFFGTTIFIVALFFSNSLSDLHYQDLNLLAAHLISIYNKYKTIDDEELFGGLNQFKGFIDFIKIRDL